MAAIFEGATHRQGARTEQAGSQEVDYSVAVKVLNIATPSSSLPLPPVSALYRRRLCLIAPPPLSPLSPSSVHHRLRRSLTNLCTTSNLDEHRPAPLPPILCSVGHHSRLPEPEPLEVKYVEIPTESAPEGEDVIAIEQDSEVAPVVPAKVVESEVQQGKHRSI
ncbi:unnamed protein product [Urochloa humidicola]